MMIARTMATIADGRVLPSEEGHRALLDRGGDLLHPLVAVGLAQDT